MNPFHHALLASSISSIYDVEEKLVSGVQTSIKGYYFFTAYLASGFPYIACDKKYFFLYSTHHGEGEIWWGKGNNLELSDFQEVALIKSGYQAETSVPITIGTKTGIYYHTNTTDPANNNMQKTHLMTYDGGGASAALHLMNWVEETLPISPLAGQNHLGYFRHNVTDTNIIGHHIGKGGLPQPWIRSISTDGGYTYTQDREIDVTTGIEDGYFAQLSLGKYFDYAGSQWWIGNISEQGVLDEFTKKMIVAKADSPYAEITQRAVIFPEIIMNVMGIYLEGDTAHIYFIKNKQSLWHGKFDLTQLELYYT